MYKKFILSLLVLGNANLATAMDELPRELQEKMQAQRAAKTAQGYTFTGRQVLSQNEDPVHIVEHYQQDRNPNFDLTATEERQMENAMKDIGINDDQEAPPFNQTMADAIVKVNPNIARKIIGANKEAVQREDSQAEIIRLRKEIAILTTALSKVGERLQ
jgi:sulfur carrier protein ThiS